MIHIEIWSDVTCPFCYIGRHSLHKALADFDEREKVEITWRSFELDPTIKGVYPGTLYDVLSKKYRLSPDEVPRMTEPVKRQGAELGLTFNFDQVIPANSHKAHEILHFAATQGKQDALKERLFQAFFTEGEVICDEKVLVKLAAEVGLDAQAVSNVLETQTYQKAVDNDISRARQLGITGVPFFLINQQFYLSGALPSAQFLQVLQQVQQKLATTASVKADDYSDVKGNC